MIDGGPFHGGASAELVVDDQATRSYYVKDRFKPVVGIAFVNEEIGKTHLKLVHTQHGAFPKLLNDYECVGCTTLPVFILRRKNDPAPDAAPETVC